MLGIKGWIQFWYSYDSNDLRLTVVCTQEKKRTDE